MEMEQASKVCVQYAYEAASTRTHRLSQLLPFILHVQDTATAFHRLEIL